ncbi:MAG TPA: tetratricopeptide repeat protein [Thermoanaerobaculia bacterium]|jgi:tetratricopeptide (TPR) repeat protein|nr:tetratricopeptide repeat protein [Thermoanaerobaculia bacterium]
MRSRTRRLLRPPSAAVLLAVLLSAGACVHYQEFDSTGHLRQQYAQQVGPQLAAGIEIPFEITPELRQALQQRLRQAPSERSKINEVLRFIFEDLKLSYSLTPTRNAVETFRTQQGNCLSFVNLFVGVAREQGLNPFYVEVTDYQKWNHREGMVVSQGHIVAGMYLEGELKTYDFLPYRPKAYKKFNPIDDLRASAHYYNNLGAEALMAGDLEKAKQLLDIAVGIAPRFEKAINNMGVALARGGQPEKALEMYQKGLEIDPENPMLLTNLTRLYQQTGRGAEADQLLAKLEESNASNPFFFVYQGEMALSRGENDKALDYMVRAMRQDSELPEVHVGFVKVYVALGDLEKARHHLERALKLDATNQDALQYARLLGQ